MSGGCWFTEFIVNDKLKPNAHLRLGCGANRMDSQTPVGTDGWGYSYRDVNGAKVHQGVRQYYGSAFGAGDVVGMLVHFPSNCWEGGASTPPTPVEQIPSEWVHPLKPHAPSTDSVQPPPSAAASAAVPQAPPAVAPGTSVWGQFDPPVHSYVRFYLNGVDQGIAFVNLTGSVGGPAAPASLETVQTAATASCYFAAAAALGGGAVRLNPGPHFEFPPPYAASGSAPGATAAAVDGTALELPQPWLPLNDADAVLARRQTAASLAVPPPGTVLMSFHPQGTIAAAAQVAPAQAQQEEVQPMGEDMVLEPLLNASELASATAAVTGAGLEGQGDDATE